MQQPFDPILASLAESVAVLLGRAVHRPVLVGLDGPVAAGKTTLARALAATLAQRGLTAAVVSADGFLLRLAKLEADGLIEVKGFPQSFNRAGMTDFLERLRRGEAPAAPAYAHDRYDVSTTERQPTDGALVVIFEGVNVLQPDLAPLYDLRLYLDAANAREVYLRRFIETPFTPERARALAPWRPDDGDPQVWGEAVWAAINGPNLARHIAHGRERADLVLVKDAAHHLSFEV